MIERNEQIEQNSTIPDKDWAKVDAKYGLQQTIQKVLKELIHNFPVKTSVDIVINALNELTTDPTLHERMTLWLEGQQSNVQE